MKTTIRTLRIIIGVAVLLAAQRYANAQGDALTYNAYISNSQTLWEKAIAQHKDNKFDQAIAYYGLLNNTMADQDEDNFEKYYDQTLDLFEALINEGKRTAESKAVLSSVYGLAMAYDGWKGVYLGPKSGGLIEEAYKTDPESPLVRKLYAGSKLYTPEMFGGDVEKALENFEVAIDLYEAKGDTVNNWLYLDALAHLGLTYRKLGQPEKAVSTFEKALRIEPDFGWVDYHLLPSARKALTTK